MCATIDDSIFMPIKVKLEGEKEDRETILDPQVKKIDKMGRVYIDRDLAEQIVTIITVPYKTGDKEKFIKVGR